MLQRWTFQPPKGRLRRNFRTEQDVKNIREIIGEFGIELDEGKLGEFEKAVLENYRTKSEVDNKQNRISELESQLASANDALEAAKSEDVGNAEEVQAMRDKIAAYEKAEEERKAQGEEQKSRSAFDEKFASALGDKKFVNAIVRGTVADKAYEVSKANPDMDLSAIIDGIVGDSEGIWENPQQSVKKMPAAGGSGGSVSGSQTIQNLDDVAGMSVEQIREHMSEIDSLIKSK